MNEAIVVRLEGPARRIQIGLGKGNLLDLDAVRGLTAAIARPASEDERVIVIEGKGSDFCAGRAPGGGISAEGGSLQIAETVARPILSLYSVLRACRLPVVAVVRGEALGLGCALAVACDVTWAETGATFALPELEKDLPPTLALTVLTPRIGPKAAAELVFTRRRIGAEEAHAIGICSRILAGSQLEEEVDALCVRLARNSMRSLATVKAYLATAGYGAHEQMSDIAAELISSSLAETLSRRPG